MRGIRTTATVILALGLLTASAARFRSELADRRPYEEFVARFELDLRRPDDVAVMRVQPGADLRAMIAAQMALADVYGSVSLRDLDAATRSSWMRSLMKLDAELAGARGLLLDAVARRPGWAYHTGLLGEVVYTLERRKSPAAAAAAQRTWEQPLLAGLEAAPGSLSLQTFLAGAYIETWGAIEPSRDVERTLRCAMRSLEFANRNFRPVSLLLGTPKAAALLPDDTLIVRAVFERERRAGDVERAAIVRERLDAVTLASRDSDLRQIKKLASLGDVWGLEIACMQWAGRYKLDDCDSAVCRTQAANVLALWPAGKRGAWLKDRRAAFIRYFLEGRSNAVEPAVLLRTAQSLSDVPDEIMARIEALAGDVSSAEARMRTSDTRGSFEWTPAVVDIARRFAADGKAPDSAKALSELAPSARDECDVLLVRRRLARSETETQEVGAMLDAITLDGYTPEMWNSKGKLSLCVDPRLDSTAKLLVAIHAEAPSLVAYGWDGGRLASVLVRDDATIELPLAELEGRHVANITVESGGKVVPGETRVVR